MQAAAAETNPSSRASVEQRIQKFVENGMTSVSLEFECHDDALITAMHKRYQSTVDGEQITFDLTQERVRRVNLKPLVNAVRMDSEGNLHIPPVMSGRAVQRWLELNRDAVKSVRANIQKADPGIVPQELSEEVFKACTRKSDGFTFGHNHSRGYIVSVPSYESKITTGRRSVHLAQKAAAMIFNSLGVIKAELCRIAPDLELTPQDIETLTVGGWVDGDHLYLDASLRVESRSVAGQLAIQWGQIAVYDIARGLTIRIG